MGNATVKLAADILRLRALLNNTIRLLGVDDIATLLVADSLAHLERKAKRLMLA